MRTILRAVLLTGVPVSILLFFGAAGLFWLIDMPYGALPWLGGIPVAAGCCISAYHAARRLRRHGLRCGLLCTLLLTALWYAAHCLFLGEFCVPRGLLLHLVCGIAGALWGLHREAPRIKKRHHALIRRREKLRLLPLLLHTPKRPAEKS